MRRAGRLALLPFLLLAGATLSWSTPSLHQGVASSTRGKVLKLKTEEATLSVRITPGTAWGTFDKDSIRGQCVGLELEETREGDKASYSLRSVEHIVIQEGELVTARGFVRGVDASSRSITFDCHAPAPCARQTLTLQIKSSRMVPVSRLEELAWTHVHVQYEHSDAARESWAGSSSGEPECKDRAHHELDESTARPFVRLVNDVDPRESFEASGYVGTVIDTFASDELQDFVNPEASGDVLSRGVAGFDFQYRLAGSRQSSRQFWVYGETVHGSRSAEVECAGAAGAVSQCPSASGSEALAIIRNATSLELFLGVRYEILRLQKASQSPASLYFLAEGGGIAVSGDGKDVADVNRIGFGVLTTNGPFAGSHLELGWGTSTLFVTEPHGRKKLDALLKWYPWDNGFSPFAQITVDADLKSGSDSLQTYIGFDFDLVHLFKVVPN